MIGLHSYDILANPEYYSKFQYEPLAIGRRDFEKKTRTTTKQREMEIVKCWFNRFYMDENYFNKKSK